MTDNSRDVQFLNPAGLGPPPGYSHVVVAHGPGRTIYIAGQVGADGAWAVAGGPTDFRAQAVRVFENLKLALRAVGATFKDVVKTNMYLREGAADVAIFRDIRDAYVDRAAPPASTLVYVSALARDDLLIEIEAIAVLPPA